MLSEAMMRWMIREERSPLSLAVRCGMTPDRLVHVASGKGSPTDDEVRALADVTGVPAADLRQAADAAPQSQPDPFRCYSVVEVAVRLGVSADTVRKLVRTGLLKRAPGIDSWRIPEFAIADYLNGAQAGLANEGAPATLPSHGVTSPTAAPASQGPPDDPGRPPPPPRRAPAPPDETAGPPRLL